MSSPSRPDASGAHRRVPTRAGRRDGDHHLRRAERRHPGGRRAARLGRRPPPAAAAPAQSARPHRRRGRAAHRRPSRPGTRASASATPTAAPTRRWTRCASAAVSPDSPATTATTCTRAPTRSRRLSAEEPGTYFLTDFLVVGFDRIVWRVAGPGPVSRAAGRLLRHYPRVVWLAGRRTPDMERAAVRAAARLGLPLEIRDVGSSRLGRRPWKPSVEWPVVVGSEASDPTTTGHSAGVPAGAA